MVTGSPERRLSESSRRSNKPIMEKRRRARINGCLNELKSLLLDSVKSGGSSHSKLEKADILEMTVKHVETLQRSQAVLSAAADPALKNKFLAGWGECVAEVRSFPALDSQVKQRLVDHLSSVMDRLGGGGSPGLVPTLLASGRLALVHLPCAVPGSPPPPPIPEEEPWRPWRN